MGHIIAFPPALPAYPGRADELDRAECVLLLGVRWWVVDHRAGEDPLPRLCAALASSAAHDAAFSIDRLMAVIARSARRVVDIHCPSCPRIGVDETNLLHAAALAQAGKGDLAERVLRDCLLSAEGAEFAVGPLEGLGSLFAAAALLLRPRRRPAVDALARPREGAVVEAWSPEPSASRTLH